MAATQRRRITRMRSGSVDTAPDAIAVEEPLEVLVDGARAATTMRTPGHDIELTLGWLLSERLIDQVGDVESVRECFDVNPDDAEQPRRSVHVVTHAKPHVRPRLHATSSACGLCGDDIIEATLSGHAVLAPTGSFTVAQILDFGQQMSDAQRHFAASGGLHAAALFNTDGELMCLREDVGRHNAVDKVIGWAVQAELLPLNGFALQVSGRAAAEIAHKCISAGIGVLSAVSAPTTMSVDLARAAQLTLIGFARDDGINIYSAPERIIYSAPERIADA